MFTLSQLQEIISEKIKLLNFDKEPRALYKPIEYALESGGKRIRPVLVLAACNLFSENVEKAISVALAFEIFHNFTLLHDDIMDNSPIRRNKPTVHKQWSKNTAILSGDAMMIEAYNLLTGLPAEILKTMLKLFNKTALEVCEGQQYDINFETKKNIYEEDYLKMIKLKTSVLIAGALKAGAIIGGADEKDEELLYNFGLNLGIAFQIQDDLLDVYADTSEFGKKTGNDILTGKKTFLMIQVLQKAAGKTAENLNNILKNNEIENNEKIKQVVKIYDSFKIKEITENTIKNYTEKALNYLRNISCENSKKTELFNFAAKLMKREK